jgi:hypothetical protein
MNRTLAIFLLFFSVESFAAENLAKEDYDGVWKSNYAVVKNEKQDLEITLDSVSVFKRHLDSNNPQILSTKKYQLVDDLLLLTFNSSDNVFGYKLALSGWKSKNKKTLYGSMFMYRKGVQFNMLHVSFDAAE